MSASAGYYWFFSAVEKVYKQVGAGSTEVYSNQYDADWEYTGIWDTWSITNQSIRVIGIADEGDGTFKYVFSVDVNEDSDSGFDTFTVTDVVAPSAPTNLSVSNSNNHPRLDWDENTESDLDEYDIWKYASAYEPTWIKTATVTNNYWIDNGVGLSDPAERIYYKVKAVDKEDNESSYSNTVWIDGYTLEKRIATNMFIEIPTSFALRQNFPNPFNPSSTIEFDLPEDSHVNLLVFNLNGQEVANLVDTFVPAGSYNVKFNAENLPSGMYFYQITAGEFRDIKRMLLIK